MQRHHRYRRRRSPGLATLQDKPVRQHPPRTINMGNPPHRNHRRSSTPRAHRAGKRPSLRRALWQAKWSPGTSPLPTQHLSKILTVSVQLWVFNPDFRYSSSSAEHTVSSQRAMKVLFQEIGDVDGILNPGLGSSSLSLEEVRVPESAYEAVERDLKARNEMLPASARVFREWRVGALHRFERCE